MTRGRLHRPLEPQRGARASALRRQHGLALPAMVFLVVVLGLMLASGLALLAQGQQGQQLQLQTARAMAAAKSGSEWGLVQVADPSGALGLDGSTLPPCFATNTLVLPPPLQDLTVRVSCTRFQTSGSVDEGGLKLASYSVLAVVTGGSAASSDYVSRQFEARYTGCKNPGAAAPLYAC